ncbi:MAG TPA: tetratricopeptide repeat protein [Rhizomicrobium sp.]|jgi:tetratricopeptide (TPR) repeat protein|nr:tetratricopeptide repeat protein [Rhizomicrobium sp.]
MIQKRRNPHDALFRAAESAGRAFERRKGAQLRQNARTAQQQKNWALAESLWRKSLEDEPGERSAVVGLAQVLVYNGKFDEAERLAGEILAQWPADENGPTVLARLAEERGDAAGAMRQWRRVLELSPTRSQALIRLGRLMIADGDYDGARGSADRLAMVAPDNPAAISLLAEIDEAKGDRACAVKRRRELTEKFPQQGAFWRDYGAALIEAGEYETCEALVARLKASDPQNGLRLEGQLLGARAPEQGHSEFWKAAHAAWPDNADFLRKYLHAALRDGRRDEARGLLDHLFASTLLRASDANFVIGLVNMLGDSGEIRKLVRSFLKRFRFTSDYRRLGIRLSRIVFADFARRPIASAPHTLAMLRHAPCDPAAKAFLEQAIASLDGTLADTDIARGECERFVALVRSRLAAKTPWSLIRVGDAESNALAYAPEFARHFDSDAAEREMVWWGRTLDAAPRAVLAARVLAAMQGADALGVPTLERLLRDVRLERRDFLSSTRAGRGLRTVMRAVEDGTLKSPLTTSAHIQHDLEKWDLYPALFDGVDDVIAVSCHARLGEVMKLARNIVVPPRHASLASFGMQEMGPKILPEVLDETIAQLPDDLAGRLVIVGAGYAGKVIIQEAKKRGAVALDLGSILDYWVGAATRSYLTAGRS